MVGPIQNQAAVEVADRWYLGLMALEEGKRDEGSDTEPEELEPPRKKVKYDPDSLKSTHPVVYKALEKLGFDFLKDEVPDELPYTAIIQLPTLAKSWQEVMDAYENHYQKFLLLLSKLSLIGELKLTGVLFELKEFLLYEKNDYERLAHNFHKLKTIVTLEGEPHQKLLKLSKGSILLLQDLFQLIPRIKETFEEERKQGIDALLHAVYQTISQAATLLRIGHTPHPPFEILVELGLAKLELSEKDKRLIVPSDIMKIMHLGFDDCDIYSSDFLFLLEENRGTPDDFLIDLKEREWTFKNFEMTGWTALMGQYPVNFPDETNDASQEYIKPFMESLSRLNSSHIQFLSQEDERVAGLNHISRRLFSLSQDETFSSIPIKPYLNAFLVKGCRVMSRDGEEKILKLVNALKDIISPSCTAGTLNRITHYLYEKKCSVIGSCHYDLKVQACQDALSHLLNAEEYNEQFEKYLERYEDNRSVDFAKEALKEQSVHFHSAIAAHYAGTFGLSREVGESDPHQQSQYGEFLEFFHNEVRQLIYYNLSNRRTLEKFFDHVKAHLEQTINTIHKDDFDAFKEKLNAIINRYFPGKNLNHFLDFDDNLRYTFPKELIFAVLMDFGIIRPTSSCEIESKEE